jgi:hypothetical protein
MEHHINCQLKFFLLISLKNKIKHMNNISDDKVIETLLYNLGKELKLHGIFGECQLYFRDNALKQLRILLKEQKDQSIPLVIYGYILKEVKGNLEVEILKINLKSL